MSNNGKSTKKKKRTGPGVHKEYMEKNMQRSVSLARESSGEDLGEALSSDLTIEQDHQLTIPQKMFLAAFSECGSAWVASKLAGIGYSTHRRWVTTDLHFVEMYELAKLQAVDKLEQEARRRAAHGVKRFKFYKGEPIINPETGKPYYELEYSDNLLTILLKAYSPEKFKDRIEQNVNGSVEAKVDVRALLAKLPVSLRKELLVHLHKGAGAQAKSPAPDLEDDDEEDESDEEE